jgi:hypothetical protein
MRISELVALANKWSGALCTLDGVPARISGRLDVTATILTERRSFSWSWRDVDIIMRYGGGRFTSDRPAFMRRG